MATYPTLPALPQGVAGTDVDPTNWNKFVDNINAIGADLVDARGDGQAFPGVDHTAAQSTDIDDALQAIRHMIADITGETNWYDQVGIALSTIARTSITFGNDDATPSVTTAGRPVGMCHTATGNTGALDVTDLDDGIDGQTIIIIGANNANKTTLKAQSVDPTSDLILQADWTEGVDTSIILIYDSVTGEWTEISRTPEIGGGGGGEGDDIDLTTEDATAGDQTVSLPTAFGKLDDFYAVVKSDSSGNTVTVDPSGAETISGATTYLLRKQYESVGMISDGSNWWKVCGSGNLVDVRDFGATGDGTTDDGDAIDDAFTAAQEGDTVKFPTGYYKVTSPIVVAKNVNIIGDGLGTQIYQSTDNNLFEFTLMAGNVVGNFYVGSAATTAGKSLIKISGNVTRMVFRDIALIGGYYGIHIYGGLECLFQNIFANKALTHPSFFGSTPQNNYWIYAERAGGFSVNGHTFLNVNLNGGSSGGINGIYAVESSSEGDIHVIGGTIEGMTGYGIYCQAFQQGISIHGIHLEGLGEAIRLVNCRGVSIDDVYAPQKINLINSSEVQIRGGYISGNVYIDKWCRNVNIIGLKGRVIGEGASINVNGVYSTSDQWDAGYGTYTPNRHVHNLVDGDLEVWTGGLPLGFATWGTGAVTEESTIVKFGSASAKVEVDAGQTVAGLRYNFDPARFLRPYTTEYRTADYQWIKSAATNEYYVQLDGGSDPEIRAKPIGLSLGGTFGSEGTVGSLAEGQWDYGDVDSLGYNTIYVRIVGSTDPDAQAVGYVKAWHKYAQMTVSAWAYKPETNGVDPILVVYYGSSAVQKTVTIPTEAWTKVTASFNLAVATSTFAVLWCAKYSGGTPGDVVYLDGLEVHEGALTSPVYDDSRAPYSDFRVAGSFLQAGEVGTMTGNETFAWGDGNIFIKDPGGAARNFDPSGSFPAFAQVTLINTADAAETITFDSGTLAEAVAQNERGIFVYDGTIWRKVYVGS